MQLQVIHDSNGKVTGVFIPVEDWQEFKQKYNNVDLDENSEPSKEQILTELKDAVKELNLKKKGNSVARPIQELLEEL